MLGVINLMIRINDNIIIVKFRMSFFLLFAEYTLAININALTHKLRISKGPLKESILTLTDIVLFISNHDFKRFNLIKVIKNKMFTCVLIFINIIHVNGMIIFNIK